MKKEIMLLVAVLFSGDICEAQIGANDNLEDAKNAVIINYHIQPGEIKSWEKRSA